MVIGDHSVEVLLCKLPFTPFRNKRAIKIGNLKVTNLQICTIPLYFRVRIARRATQTFPLQNRCTKHRSAAGRQIKAVINLINLSREIIFKMIDECSPATGLTESNIVLLRSGNLHLSYLSLEPKAYRERFSRFLASSLSPPFKLHILFLSCKIFPLLLFANLSI